MRRKSIAVGEAIANWPARLYPSDQLQFAEFDQGRLLTNRRCLTVKLFLPGKSWSVSRLTFLEEGKGRRFTSFEVFRRGCGTLGPRHHNPSCRLQSPIGPYNPQTPIIRQYFSDRKRLCNGNIFFIFSSYPMFVGCCSLWGYCHPFGSESEMQLHLIESAKVNHLQSAQLSWSNA